MSKTPILSDAEKATVKAIFLEHIFAAQRAGQDVVVAQDTAQLLRLVGIEPSNYDIQVTADGDDADFTGTLVGGRESVLRPVMGPPLPTDAVVPCSICGELTRYSASARVHERSNPKVCGDCHERSVAANQKAVN